MKIKSVFSGNANKGIVFSSYLSFSSWFIPAGLAAFIPVLLISSLGEAGYGTFALLISIAGYFTIADLSLDAFLIPKIASSKNPNEVSNASAWLFILIAIGVFITSVGLIVVLRTTNTWELGWISGLAVLLFGILSASQLLVTGTYILASGTGVLNLFNTISLWVNLTSLMMVFVLKFFNCLTIETVILYRILSNTGVVVIILLKQISRFNFKQLFLIVNAEAFHFLKFSLIGKALSYCSFNFDKIIVASFLTLEDVGLVAFPMQLGFAILMGASKFCLPLLPIASKHIVNENEEAGNTELSNYVTHFMNIIFLLIGLFIGVVLIWIDKVIPLIYNQSSFDSNFSITFSLILFGFWLISWSSIPANILPGWKKMSINVYSSAIRAAIIFLTMLCLITTSLGITAVAIGVVLGGLWEVFFLIWFLKKYLLTGAARLLKTVGLPIMALLIATILLSNKTTLLNAFYMHVIVTIIFLCTCYLLYKISKSDIKADLKAKPNN